MQEVYFSLEAKEPTLYKFLEFFKVLNVDSYLLRVLCEIKYQMHALDESPMCEIIFVYAELVLIYLS